MPPKKNAPNKKTQEKAKAKVVEVKSFISFPFLAGIWFQNFETLKTLFTFSSTNRTVQHYT